MNLLPLALSVWGQHIPANVHLQLISVDWIAGEISPAPGSWPLCLLSSCLHHDRHLQPLIWQMFAVRHPFPVPLCLSLLRWNVVGPKAPGLVSRWMWNPGKRPVSNRVHFCEIKSHDTDEAETAKLWRSPPARESRSCKLHPDWNSHGGSHQ